MNQECPDDRADFNKNRLKDVQDRTSENASVARSDFALSHGIGLDYGILGVRPKIFLELVHK